MTWLPIYVLLGLDIVTLYLNARLLMICFKDKSKYTFLENCGALAICQGAYQVIILTADSVELWNGFTILPGETCSPFRVLSLSVMFFQTCNLTAMMTVYNEHPAGRKTQEPSSKARMYAALSLGVVGSAVIIWHNCCVQDLIPLLALKTAFVVIVALVILLLAAALTKNVENNTLESQAAIDKCASPLKDHKRSKKPIFFTALLLLGLVLIVSGVPNTDSMPYEDDVQVTLFKEALYSVITKFALGIVLPVTLYDLINASYVGKKDQTVTSII